MGSVGYDFVRYSEVLPEENPDEIGIETVQLMLMKEFIVVDHVAETLTAVILESDDETGKETAAKKAAELIKTAMQEQKESEVRLFPDGVITKKSDTLEEYSEKVNKIKQYIRDGHIFQTVLSQRWTIATGQDGFDLYCELRELNPSPYLYYFNFGDFEVLEVPRRCWSNNRGIGYLPARSPEQDQGERQRKKMTDCTGNCLPMKKNVPNMSC